ncbi:MAG: hypothetical protein AUI16_22875 [Alphaproteobacteria bacterium 13_2_20CM_2_64_7]|nr:MAG: hypothetical protein AUI16_22875 [Alphaproteobacteria bacterium 13_2_20CM_2_64_7]
MNDDTNKRRPRPELAQGAASKFLLIEPIVADAAPPRDIRVDDEIRPLRRDEFAVAEPPASAQWIQLALLGGALAVGLCLGWIGGFVSSRFFIPTTVAAVPHADVSPCGREGSCAAAKSDREASKAAGPRARIVERSSARGMKEASAAANRDVTTTSSISMQERAKIEPRLPAMPETRPTTIEGWTIREVIGNTVVLQGPDGVWRATQGDTVPGVGRIDSIVRWGSRWIVATTRGLISTLD